MSRIPRSTLVASLGLLVSLSVVLFAPSALGATPPRPPQGAVTYHDNSPDLTQTSYELWPGVPTFDGGCNFSFPHLVWIHGTPPPQRRQIWTDFKTCITALETGVSSAPWDAGTAMGKGVAQEVASNSTKALNTHSPGVTCCGGGGGGTTYTATYRIIWSDPFGIVTTWLRSSITYTVTGSCVGDASGYWRDYYRGLSGWYRQSVASYINPLNCSYRKVWTNGSYRNDFFCAPVTYVTTTYNGVTVEGAPAASTGWVDNTYSTEHPTSDPLCFNLHYSDGF
jgi:hypothetical protein